MLKLKIIKAVVFIMTFLLIFGTVLMVSRFIRKIENRDKPAPVSQISLDEPQGSSISQISGSDDNLYILVRGGNRPDRIIILDTETQRKISNININ